ncbi:MAG: Ig-like domain-containing protein [Muribaculaceae bacterium]|nr:Ig-like domain-containing protein [Muribaculaceae bacterium]
MKRFLFSIFCILLLSNITRAYTGTVTFDAKNIDLPDLTTIGSSHPFSVDTNIDVIFSNAIAKPSGGYVAVLPSGGFSVKPKNGAIITEIKFYCYNNATGIDGSVEYSPSLGDSGGFSDTNLVNPTNPVWSGRSASKADFIIKGGTHEIHIKSMVIKYIIEDFTYSYKGQTLHYTKIDDNYVSTVIYSANKPADNISGNLELPAEVYYGGKFYKLKEILPNTFSNSPGLASIKIPNTVTTIGENAFKGCKALTKLEIETGNTSLFLYSQKDDNGLSQGLFNDCPLNEIYLGHNITYSDAPFNGGKFLDKLTIGEKVSSLRSDLFGEAGYLTDVVFEDADASLSLVTTGTITDGVSKTIYFFENSPIKTLYLGRNLSYSDVPQSGYSPFNNKPLESIIIGSKVTALGNNLFKDCNDIKEIDVRATLPPAATSSTFTEYSANLKVPFKSYEQYLDHDIWSKFNIESEGQPKKVVITAGETIELPVNQEIKLTASADIENGSYDYVWSIEDPEIASLSPERILKGLQEGKTRVTVKYGPVMTSSTVNVKYVVAETVTVAPSSVELTWGESCNLNATLYPEVLSNSTIFWSSYNKEVATVDDHGVVSTHKFGTAKIQAMSGRGKGYCEVTVKAAPISSISINESDFEILQGGTMQLSATVEPWNCDPSMITWSSSREEVAVVDKNGFVVTKESGDAIITASYNNIKSQVKVTVKDFIPEYFDFEEDFSLSDGTDFPKTSQDVANTGRYTSKSTGISYTMQGVQLQGGYGTPYYLWVNTYDYRDASLSFMLDYPCSEIELSTDGPNSTSFKLYAEGKYIGEYGKETGEFTVKIEIPEEYQKTGTLFTLCEFTSNMAFSKLVFNSYERKPSTIRLNEELLKLIMIEKVQLEAYHVGENNSQAAFTWKSNDEDVVTVSEEGLVIPVGYGTAYITVSDGDDYATCKVIVAESFVEREFTITESFRKPNMGMPDANSIPKTAKTYTSTKTGIEYTLLDSYQPNNSNGTYLRLNSTNFNRSDAYMSFTLDYYCTKIVVSAYAPTSSSSYTFNANNKSLATVYPDNDKEYTIEIPSEYQAPGTVYKIGVNQERPCIYSLTYYCQERKEVVQPISVTLNKSSISMDLGSSEQLTATIKPLNTFNKTILWESSNSDVVEVSEDGTLTAKWFGDAVITASCGEKKATCKVMVKRPNYSITTEYHGIEGLKYSLKTGETMKLKVTVTPECDYGKIIWKFDDYVTAEGMDEGDGSEIRITAKDNAAGKTVKFTINTENYDWPSSNYQLRIKEPIKGDANDNDVITVSDIVTVANHILKFEDKENINFCYANADINDDGIIDVSDVSAVTNIVLGKEEAYNLVATRSMGDMRGYAKVEDNLYEGSELRFTLKDAYKYVNLQADLVIPEGVEIYDIVAGDPARAHILSYNQIEENIVRIVVYSLENQSFSSSNQPLFIIRGRSDDSIIKITFENVLASDEFSNRYYIETGEGEAPETTGVDQIGYESITTIGKTGGVMVYNAAGKEIFIYALDGRLVTHTRVNDDREFVSLSKGLYIVTVDNHENKVIVK